ncbi:helix-turn-helix domain-containing protein [Nocardiopsis dassonvillei]|uniref:helix-turn-helix domain-containing protein n=1 Tax=Nocardiopsis dassonvillei TaxID=2014 RepID=UPI00200F7B47|nr:helix-turn-helix domain-containing protein [Nocardiopsis dassonvillei]MCK9871306.1 helix-turn-helix domain-containing protein [Nocardiopsis dassonvillei]
MSRTVPGLAEIGALPVWVTPIHAGRLLGMSRTTVYRHLNDGTFPVPVYKVGRHWRVPTAGLLVFLGLSTACGCGARTTQKESEDR